MRTCHEADSLAVVEADAVKAAKWTQLDGNADGNVGKHARPGTYARHRLGGFMARRRGQPLHLKSGRSAVRPCP
jgi:hypothetical protein